MSCEHQVLARTRWEPAEYCQEDAEEDSPYCAWHGPLHDREGRAEERWEFHNDR